MNYKYPPMEPKQLIIKLNAMLRQGWSFMLSCKRIKQDWRYALHGLPDKDKQLVNHMRIYYMDERAKYTVDQKIPDFIDQCDEKELEGTSLWV